MPECRRAFEIDLFAFLETPRAETFADFRAHYPGCPDCAREVRAWSELQARLAAGANAGPASAPGAGAHPAPERLLRFADDAPELGPEARRQLEAHLAGCPSCRDELAALGHVAARPTAAPAAGAPGPARAGFAASVRGLLAALGRLAWHPAVAYAALLLVLGPVLYLEWERGAPLAPPRAEERAATAARPEGTQEKTEAAPAQAERAGRSLEDRVQMSSDPVPFEPGARTQEAPAGAQAEPAPPPSEVQKPTSQDFADAARARPGSPEPKTLPEHAPALRGMARPEREAGGGSSAAEAAPGSPQAGAVAGAAAAPRLEPVPGEPQLLRLRIPLLPSDAAVEVRLVAPDGRRALVERFDAPDGPVALRVPRSWLGAGTHRLEIRTPEGGRDLPLEVPAALSDPSTPLPGSGE